MLNGRKPRPSELVEVLDHPSHGRKSNPDEPKASGRPVKPAFLEDFYKGRASRLWDEYSPRAPWLKAPDSMALAGWCCLVAEFEDGPERMTASRIAQMRAIGSCLGLDPNSRSRLHAEGGGAPKDDPAAKYFKC